ncbi:MAG: hypothetical protein RLY89_2931 [Bacteroidota bacterium]|jgi:hypothetical protein
MKKMAFLLMAMMGFGFMAQAQTDSLQQYTGKFTFPEGSIVSYVTISVDGGKLVFSSDKGNGSLEKVATDSFSIPEYQGTGKFVRNADNAITGVVIDVMGYHIEGTKDKTVAILDRKYLLKSKGQESFTR